MEQNLDLATKLEEIYKANASESKEKQINSLVECINRIGYSAEVIDYCISRLESRSNKRNQLNANIYGLAFPAIILGLSMLLALAQVFNPINVTIIWLTGVLVSLVMIGTFVFLQGKQRNRELVERLYDIKERMLNPSDGK